MSRLAKEISNTRDLISSGKLEKAFDTLRYNFNKGKYATKVINLSSRYHILKKQRSAGLVSQDNYTTETNQIVHALLELMNEIENNKELTLPPIPVSIRKIAFRFVIGFLLLISIASGYDCYYTQRV